LRGRLIDLGGGKEKRQQKGRWEIQKDCHGHGFGYVLEPSSFESGGKWPRREKDRKGKRSKGRKVWRRGGAKGRKGRGVGLVKEGS